MADDKAICCGRWLNRNIGGFKKKRRKQAKKKKLQNHKQKKPETSSLDSRRVSCWRRKCGEALMMRVVEEHYPLPEEGPVC